MLLVWNKFQILQNDIISKRSLNLLNENALKLQPKVIALNFQKLINKKDVKPINSHPKISVKKLLPQTSIIIDIINQLINSINSSSLSSYLK